MIVADTHAWLWWLVEPSRLSPGASDALAEADVVAIAAITLWETANLAQRNRVDLHVDTWTWFQKALAPGGTTVLPLTAAIAMTAARLGVLRDPADRLIAATALEHHARLVTKDGRIRDANVVDTIW